MPTGPMGYMRDIFVHTPHFSPVVLMLSGKSLCSEETGWKLIQLILQGLASPAGLCLIVLYTGCIQQSPYTVNYVWAHVQVHTHCQWSQHWDQYNTFTPVLTENQFVWSRNNEKCLFKNVTMSCYGWPIVIHWMWGSHVLCDYPVCTHDSAKKTSREL